MIYYHSITNKTFYFSLLNNEDLKKIGNIYGLEICRRNEPRGKKLKILRNLYDLKN